MTGITQKIPNYIGGISQQPDELMPPGSVRDAVNVLPDVTNGLTKRAGSRLINPLYQAQEDGTWFHIDRDPQEKYIGKINRDGTVQIFSCYDGQPAPVLYRDKPPGVLPELIGNTAYADCNWERVQLAKESLQEAIDERDEKQAVYDQILVDSGGASATREIVDSYYKDERAVNGFMVTNGFYDVGDGEVEVEGTDTPLNAQVRRGNRQRSSVYVYKPNPNYRPELPRDSPYLFVGKGDTFARDVVKVVETDQEPPDVEGARAEYEAAQAEVDARQEIYQKELDKCAGVPEPETRERPVMQFGVVPDYLKTREDQYPLQVLTINDYTFVNNPNVAVSMSKSDAEKRPSEAFDNTPNRRDAITPSERRRETSPPCRKTSLASRATASPESAPRTCTASCLSSRTPPRCV